MRVAMLAGLGLIGGAVAYRYRAGTVQAATDAIDMVKGNLMQTGIDLENANLRAFLRMIRYSEGTDGAHGYRMLFGGRLFSGYADHPRISVRASGYTSTAAGAYQILSRTWDDVRDGLKDFGPASQDEAAARLIRRRGALDDVYAGRFADAVRKVAREWASLPGSPYGQPVRTMAQVTAAYAAAGGSFGSMTT
ncbi:MAG: glycoside hydrolase family 104 protein [Pseudomonadota bacterium]